MTKQWWYESWVYSIEQDLDKWRTLGILIGSFSNPEAAKKMMSKEHPQYETSDEDFDKSYEMVENMPFDMGNLLEEEKPRRRRRRLIR